MADPTAPSDPDNADRIGANTQRTVERTALRKVRSLVDELEASEARQRRRQKILVAAVAIAFAAILAYVAIPESREDIAARRAQCEYAFYLAKTQARRELLAQQSPALPQKELETQVKAEGPAIALAAAQSCANAPR